MRSVPLSDRFVGNLASPQVAPGIALATNRRVGVAPKRVSALAVVSIIATFAAIVVLTLAVLAYAILLAAGMRAGVRVRDRG
jgi:hypothetical protein